MRCGAGVIWQEEIIKMRLSLCYLVRLGPAASPAPLTWPGSEYLSPLSPGRAMAVAFVFPGQGSHRWHGKGLAEAFAPARQVFEEVDAALGERLSEMIGTGRRRRLRSRKNAQPALMAVSLAAMRVLEAEAGVKLARDAPSSPATRSANIPRSAAAQIVLDRRRGTAASGARPCHGRSGAVAPRHGGADTVFEYGDAKVIAAEAAGADVVQQPTTMAAKQVVLSGDKAAVERAVEIAKTRVQSGPCCYRSPAPFPLRLDCKPAADAMAEALANVAVKPSSVPLVAKRSGAADQ